MTKNIYRVLILAGLLIGAAFVIVPAGNEILGENAVIRFDSGRLLVMETRD